MNYGLYLSATGALTNMHRHDVLANNLANLNTVGFRADQVLARQRLPERLENPGSFADPKEMLERLGGGTLVDPTRTSGTQGPLQTTGNDFDVALDGEGWLVVGPGRGNDPAALRFTRDGRFTLNDREELVLIASGQPVLGRNGRPIRLQADERVQIDDAGNIRQGGQLAGQLRIVANPPTGSLVRADEGLFRLADDTQATLTPSTARVRQGFTEGSNVNAIKAMTNMMSAAKAAQANLKLMQYHDQTLNQIFNTVGRVA